MCVCLLVMFVGVCEWVCMSGGGVPRPGYEHQRVSLGVSSLLSPKVPEFNPNHQACIGGAFIC